MPQNDTVRSRETEADAVIRAHLGTEYVAAWLTCHMLELVRALNRWAEVSRTPRSFPARYFGKGRDIPGLEAELKLLMPQDEDKEIADVAADLTAFLADCFDAGQFGDLSDLRATLGKSKPINSFRMADTVLKLCARYAPFALSGPSDQRRSGDRPPVGTTATTDAALVESGGGTEPVQSSGLDPKVSVGPSDRDAPQTRRALSWSQFWLGLKPLPIRPKSAESTDEGSSRPATFRDLSPLFRVRRRAKSAHTTKLASVLPLVVSQQDNCRLTVGRSDREEDCDRLAPAGYTMRLPEELRNRHILTVGQTGAGKTTKLILPLLRADIADREKSVVVLDAKGELVSVVAELTSQYRGERPLYVDFRDPTRSLGWNPLFHVHTKGDARELALRICTATEEGHSTGDSRFFLYSAVDLLTGIIVALRTTSTAPTLAHALAITDLSVKDFECFANKHDVQELKRFASYIGTASHNAETVLADLRMRLGIWRDERVCATTSDHELDFSALVSKPSVLVIHIDEQDVDLLRPLTNAFMTSLFGALLTASSNRSTKALALPVSLIIEEFASAVGRIAELERRLNTIRQRRISITASVQSLTQIHLEYGKASQPLLAGFSTKVYFPNLIQEDAEYVSRCSGAMTIIKEETATYSERSPIDFSEAETPATRTTKKLSRRPLFTPDEITSAAPSHRRLGRAVTFEFPDVPMFQSFLTPAYMFPDFRDILSKASNCDNAIPLRQEALLFHPPQVVLSASPSVITSISDTTNWSDADIRAKLAQVKELLHYSEVAGESAGKWWDAFEKENDHRPNLILRLAEELALRNASVKEFFLSYVYSNTDNIQANIHFLDYRRLKSQEEEAKKKAKMSAASEAEPTGDQSDDVELDFDELLQQLDDENGADIESDDDEVTIEPPVKSRPQRRRSSKPRKRSRGSRSKKPERKSSRSKKSHSANESEATPRPQSNHASRSTWPSWATRLKKKIFGPRKSA